MKMLGDVTTHGVRPRAGDQILRSHLVYLKMKRWPGLYLWSGVSDRSSSMVIYRR